MSRSKQLAFNTGAIYARSFVTTILTLFSSRWVLQALGAEDYGIYSAIASITFIFTFLNGVLAGSVARHFAYGIGEGKLGEVRGWFNTAFSLHFITACILVTAGWFLGHWYIEHCMNMAHDRMLVGGTIMNYCLISAFFTMVAIPYTAMFTAKQRISELSLIGAGQSVLIFVLACSLSYISQDHLKVYAFGMSAIITLIQCALIVRGTLLYPECRICSSEWFCANRTWEVLRFAGWTMFGGLGVCLRDSGAALLLNSHSGPRVNAAYGIAYQVSQATNQLATALLSALAPEMTTAEGRGERERMLRLAQQMNKYGTLVVLFFAIPLMLQMEFVLTAWLSEPPEQAAVFCRIILMVFLVDRLSAGYMLAVNAYGRIAAYQATVGGVLLFTLPLGWYLLHLGAPASGVLWAFLITGFLSSMGRVFWACRLFRTSARSWLCNTLIPCVKVAIAATTTGAISIYLPFGKQIVFLLTIIATVTAGAITAWCYALTSEERHWLAGLFARSVVTVHRK